MDCLLLNQVVNTEIFYCSSLKIFLKTDFFLLRFQFHVAGIFFHWDSFFFQLVLMFILLPEFPAALIGAGSDSTQTVTNPAGRAHPEAIAVTSIHSCLHCKGNLLEGWVVGWRRKLPDSLLYCAHLLFMET